MPGSYCWTSPGDPTSTHPWCLVARRLCRCSLRCLPPVWLAQRCCRCSLHLGLLWGEQGYHSLPPWVAGQGTEDQGLTLPLGVHQGRRTPKRRSQNWPWHRCAEEDPSLPRHPKHQWRREAAAGLVAPRRRHYHSPNLQTLVVFCFCQSLQQLSLSRPLPSRWWPWLLPTLCWE